MKIFASLVAAVALTACGTAPPKPFERELLTRPEMALDADAMTGAWRRHAEASKEGSTGDSGMAGTNCGCN